MNGLVFTGNMVNEEIGGYDLVVFLMKGGYQDQPLKTLERLYYEAITIVDIEKFYDFMAKHGFVSRYKLVDLWTKSELSFKRFMEILKNEYNNVFLSLKRSILNTELLEVFEKLNRRQGKSVIVSDSSSIPLFYIQLCLDDNSYQITVVNDISLMRVFEFNLLILNARVLTQNIYLPIPEGTTIILTNSENCLFLPNWLNPVVNTVLLMRDISNYTHYLYDGCGKFAF